MNKSGVLAAAVLVAALSYLAQAADPPSRPVEQPAGPGSTPGQLADADAAMLARLSATARLDFGTWSPPVVERFDGKKDDHPWKATIGKFELADDGLIIPPQEMFTLYRPLPRQFAGARGLRIDLWVEVEKQRPEAGQKIGIFVTTPDDLPDTKSSGHYLWAFCNGVDGCWLQMVTPHDYEVWGQPREMPLKHLFHVSYEIAGRFSRGLREDLDSRTMVVPDGFQAAGDMVVGFFGRGYKARVAQASIRGLANPPAAASQPGDPPTEPQINQFVLTRLIPLLDAPDFQTREKYTRLLAGLGPMIEPALRAALDDKDLSPEIRARLNDVYPKEVPYVRVSTSTPGRMVVLENGGYLVIPNPVAGRDFTRYIAPKAWPQDRRLKDLPFPAPPVLEEDIQRPPLEKREPKLRTVQIIPDIGSLHMGGVTFDR